MPRRKAQISNEEDDNSSKPVPNGWEFVVRKKTNGSKMWYQCPETGQMFYKYEDLVRYVKYAKETKVSIYAPHFPAFRAWQKKRKAKLPAGNDFWAKWPKVPPSDQIGSLKFAVHQPGRISRLPDFCWGAGGGKFVLERRPGFKESDCPEKEDCPSKDGSDSICPQEEEVPDKDGPDSHCPQEEEGPRRDGSESNCPQEEKDPSEDGSESEYQEEEEDPSSDGSESECPEEEEGPSKDSSESECPEEEESPSKDGSKSDCLEEEEDLGEDGRDFETVSLSQRIGRETKRARIQKSNDVAAAGGQELQDVEEIKNQRKGKKVVSGQEVSIEEGSDFDAKLGCHWNGFKTKIVHIQESNDVGQPRDPEEITYEKKGKKVISYPEDSSNKVSDFDAKFLSCWPGIRTKGVVIHERDDETPTVRQINPENQFVEKPVRFKEKELGIQEKNNEADAIRENNPQNQFAENSRD